MGVHALAGTGEALWQGGRLGCLPGTDPVSCLTQLTNKIVFVVSFVGNRGTFIRGYKAMVMDMEFLYHVGYILTSVLGLFAHELFYSILVSPPRGRGWVGHSGASLSLCCSRSSGFSVLFRLTPVQPSRPSGLSGPRPPHLSTALHPA